MFAPSYVSTQTISYQDTHCMAPTSIFFVLLCCCCSFKPYACGVGIPTNAYYMSVYNKLSFCSLVNFSTRICITTGVAYIQCAKMAENAEKPHIDRKNYRLVPRKRERLFPCFFAIYQNFKFELHWVFSRS